MADRRYLLVAIHDVVRALDRFQSSCDEATDLQPVIFKLDYLQRLVVSLDIDDTVTELVGLACRKLSEIDDNRRLNFNTGYSSSLNMTGLRGRPSYDITEEQLSHLLEQGFKVRDISNILQVSCRTVERRMSAFGLSVSGEVKLP